MEVEIEDRYEQARGCGFRQPGGMYLVSGGQAMECGRLPFRLTVCAHCGQGIKFCRAWTWVDGDMLRREAPECELAGGCGGCLLGAEGPELGRVGLLWIGEKFYRTPEEFLSEGAAMGFSRRLPTLPRDFVAGETWVFLAHRKACRPVGEETERQAGVFFVWRPTGIEYVVTGEESEEELERLVKRGFRLVRVHRAQGDIEEGEA